MASEPSNPTVASAADPSDAGDSVKSGDDSSSLSKKQAKKDARKAEKAEKRLQQAAAASAKKDGGNPENSDAADPFASNYGDVSLVDIQSKAVTDRKWTDVAALVAEIQSQCVLVRGAAQAMRPVSKKMAFLVLRQCTSTVQCVLVASKDAGTSPLMVSFVTGLPKESIVDVEGIVSVPKDPIKGTTQQVEIHVRKLYCLSRALEILPFNIEDAARSETDFQKAEITGEQFVRVNQDTRLDHRVLDLRTPANNAIFRIQSEVESAFRDYLRSKGFVGIHSPKLIAGSSEGGASVFKLDYKGQPACLAQSPQLYKQMAICSGFRRVFEVGPVFRAEDSYTHRHLCEFVGLDAEMEINEHYFEVCDVIDGLFIAIFKHLSENCKTELEAIDRQYPFEPLKYLPKTLRLTYDQGVQMLKEAGIEVPPMGDLNTEAEKKLGRLVREKYDTDFYILYRYPLAVRPFYTMPCHDDPAYSNSFDVFIRGEEIMSGAQRVHVPELLKSRAEELGIDVNTIKDYIDSFRYGAPPHGGFGVGLERVVILFCALNNIRKVSLFPRDPRRLVP